ncbi:hypothetical protein [Crocosphaera sp. Alani8]|uniref:hypothetical protein n=1 Tax=Crocosphaera sp. Alani8 TaxID=3038952 RepID=UPI00313BA217
MQLSSDSFYQAVSYLEHHTESIRVKKLIFCICHKNWENNPNILNGLSMESLVEKLIAQQETLEALTLSLYRLVKTLNRPKIYAGIAKAIVEQLEPVYREISEDTELLQPSTNSQDTHFSDDTVLLEQAVINLSNHPETARIHKLVYAITKNSWENDLNRIQHYGLKNLISEILEIYPDYNSLKEAVVRLVGNINKKNLYLSIAQVILQQIDGLYKTLQKEEVSTENSSNSYSTEIISVRNSHNHQSIAPSSTSSLETSVINVPSAHVITQLETVQSTATPSPPKPEYDILELRLEIMQYTNPLRAKILLFSLLFHPWDRSGQDWSTLRSYALDDLLEQILQSGRSVAEIEGKLYNMAKSLHDSDSHLQTASTVVETIKPFL